MASTNPIRATYPASATGAQQALSVDWRDDVPSGYSYEVQFNAGASGSVTVETTLDDINDSSIAPDWIAETAAITADGRGVIGHPVAAVRLNIGSLTGGSITFKLLGGSILGDATGPLTPGGGGADSDVNLIAVGSNPVATAGVSGLLAVGGNAASGATDTGYPVKIGGVYNSTPSNLASGQRGDAQLTINGSLIVGGTALTLTDGSTTTLAGLSASTGLTPRALAVANSVFNGTGWDRQRGTTLGTFAIGPDADDVAASVGANPVPVGGVFQTNLPNYTSGDRAQAQFTSNGQLVTAVSGTAAAGADGAANTLIFPMGSATHTARTGLAVTPSLFNGTTWDRQRMNPAASGGAALVELGPYVFGRVIADGQIKGSAGFIHTITIAPTGTTAAGVLTIYNSTTETGTVVFSVSLPATSFTAFSVTLDVACSTGIFVGFDASLANVGVTVSYR